MSLALASVDFSYRLHSHVTGYCCLTLHIAVDLTEYVDAC